MLRILMSILLFIPAMAGAFEFPETPWAPRVHVCPRAVGPLTIDGRLDEASWRDAPATEPFVDIRGADAPAPRHATTARLLWDDTCLYVGAQLDEPHLWATYTTRDTVIYHENDFEVFIDPDGDNHNYAELEINALNTVWDLLLVKPYRDGGPALDGWDIHGLRTGVHLDGTLNNPADTDRGWSVEIAIPWAALRECAGGVAVPPADGDTWRVNFSRVQWQRQVVKGAYVKASGADGKPLPEDNWVWSPQGIIAMHCPERWGYVTFSGEPAGAAPVTGKVPEDLVAGPRFLMPLYYAQRSYQEEYGNYATSLTQLDLPPAVNSYLELQVRMDKVSLHATAWQFEARLKWRGKVTHVDDTGRIWITD